MSWILEFSGTAAVTVGTEDIVAIDTNNGTLVFEVDTSAMQLGDVTELRAYTMCLAGGASVLAWKCTVGPSSAVTPIFPSPPIASDIQCVFSIKQIAGTARSYPWKVLRI